MIKTTAEAPNFFFGVCVWPEMFLQKLGVFFFKTLQFSLEKLLFGEKCFFGRIGGMKNFWKNKLGAGFENFHIFWAKKRRFFPIFGPSWFWGRRPEIFFWTLFQKKKTLRFGLGGGQIVFFFGKGSNKFFRAFGPKTTRVQKLEKMSGFG